MKEGRLHEAKGLMVTCTGRDEGENNKTNKNKKRKMAPKISFDNKNVTLLHSLQLPGDSLDTSKC